MDKKIARSERDNHIIYKRICEGTILQYKKDSLDTDNLVTDSEVIGD